MLCDRNHKHVHTTHLINSKDFCSCTALNLCIIRIFEFSKSLIFWILEILVFLNIQIIEFYIFWNLCFLLKQIGIIEYLNYWNCWISELSKSLIFWNYWNFELLKSKIFCIYWIYWISELLKSLFVCALRYFKKVKGSIFTKMKTFKDFNNLKNHRFQ